MVGTWQISYNCSSPGSSIFLSPRNLFITSPLTRLRSSSSNSMSVPASWANTPPRSISPTRSTGASTSAAMPIFTISSCLRLISAGLPAPSSTMTSYRQFNVSYALKISGISCFLYLKYSLAGIFFNGTPFTMTCDPTSLVGLSKMGFICTHGSIPAASACMTCALPISSPSFVI